MEIKRERLNTGPATARDRLRGGLEGDALEQYVQERVLTTTLDDAVSWARGNSLFPAVFGLACCSIEFISLVGSRLRETESSVTAPSGSDEPPRLPRLPSSAL